MIGQACLLASLVLAGTACARHDRQTPVDRSESVARETLRVGPNTGIKLSIEFDQDADGTLVFTVPADELFLPGSAVPRLAMSQLEPAVSERLDGLIGYSAQISSYTDEAESPEDNANLALARIMTARGAVEALQHMESIRSCVQEPFGGSAEDSSKIRHLTIFVAADEDSLICKGSLM